MNNLLNNTCNTVKRIARKSNKNNSYQLVLGILINPGGDYQLNSGIRSDRVPSSLGGEFVPLGDITDKVTCHHNILPV